MSRPRDYLVPPAKGTLASLSPAELSGLDALISGADLMSEADSGVRHARKDVIRAGQAAVDVINARRGRS